MRPAVCNSNYDWNYEFHRVVPTRNPSLGCSWTAQAIRLILRSRFVIRAMIGLLFSKRALSIQTALRLEVVSKAGSSSKRLKVVPRGLKKFEEAGGSSKSQCPAEEQNFKQISFFLVQNRAFQSPKILTQRILREASNVLGKRFIIQNSHEIVWRWICS